mgnify:CR=1 FL=1
MAATAKKVENEESSIPVKSGKIIHFPDLEVRIAELAYYKSEQRGFLPGYALSDWLEAEKELGL